MEFLDRAARCVHSRLAYGNESRALLTDALSDAHPLARIVAAIALCHLEPTLLTDNSIHEMTDTLRIIFRRTMPSIYAEYSTVSDGCDLEQDLLLALAELVPGQADNAIPLLIARWPDDPQLYEIGHALIALAFSRTNEPIVAGTLNATQESVLRAVAEQQDIWTGDGNWAGILAEHGLPESREAVMQFVS